MLCMKIDRRAFIAASGALLLTSHLGTQGEEAGPPTAPPSHLFERTFLPLASSLLSREMWHPFPTILDRDGWNKVSPEVRNALIDLAEESLQGDWPQITATMELSFERTGDRAKTEAAYFQRRTRLSTLVLGECVTAQGKYLDQIANGLWLICEESSWASLAHLAVQKAGIGLPDVMDPIIDLFAAETGATLSWIHYLLQASLDKISPLLAPRIQIEVNRRILDVFDRRDHPNWEGLNGRPHHLNNWNPWINSNLITSILLMEVDPARRARLALKSCRSLDAYLEDVSPDGGCEEGPGYWARSAASLLDCGTTLISAHTGKGDACLKNTYMKAAGQFIANTHIAGNYYVDYGDAHPTENPAPELLYRFGKATDDDVLMQFGSYTAHERGIFAGAENARRSLASSGALGSLSREIAAVFASEEIRNQPQRDALVRDSWYPALGLMTARQKEGASAGFYLALQAAGNGRSHAHNDSGSFIVFHNGHPVFIDAGVGQYTKQTFSSDRYKIWTMQSAYHNLPTVNGVMQHEGRQYRAKVLEYQSTDSTTRIRVDLAPAYPPEAGIQIWKCTMTLDRIANRILIQEEFHLQHAVPVMLSFLSMAQPTATTNSLRVGDSVLSFDGINLSAKIEPLPLDVAMQHSFPLGVWRTVLTTKTAVSDGNWKMEIRSA